LVIVGIAANFGYQPPVSPSHADKDPYLIQCYLKVGPLALAGCISVTDDTYRWTDHATVACVAVDRIAEKVAFSDAT